jgi:hypothetical protein
MNLVFDTANVLASFECEVPLYALPATIFESRLAYGHRIDFVSPYRFRFQMRELSSILTSYVYTRATSDLDALNMLREMQQSMLDDIRNALNSGYAIDDLSRFITDNFMFVNRKSGTSTVNILNHAFDVSDPERDIKIGECIGSIYKGILTKGEIRHILTNLNLVIDNIVRARS